MRIDNAANDPSLNVSSSAITDRAHTNPSAAASSQTAESANAANDASANSELSQLVKQLKTLPDVRDDAVQVARQRLDSGAYLTRQAAEGTAAAIVDR